jgi:hypothetical protein
MALSELERALLDFERDWVLEAGPKDAAIKERLGLSPSAYYRLRRTLLDNDEALAYDPLVVRRLRRDVDDRRRARFEGHSAGSRRP